MSEKYDPHPIGRGTMKIVDGKLQYAGTVPFDAGEEEVAIIRSSDLELMVKDGRVLLMSKYHITMPASLIEKFPNWIEWHPNDKSKEVARLYFEQYMYGTEPAKELWIRYVTVDEALAEEDWPT